MFIWNDSITKEFHRQIKAMLEPPKEVAFSGKDRVTSVLIRASKGSYGKGRYREKAELHLLNSRENTFQIIKSNNLENGGLLFRNLLNKYGLLYRTEAGEKSVKLLFTPHLKAEAVLFIIQEFNTLYP